MRHRASLGITEHSGYGIVAGLAEISQGGEVEAVQATGSRTDP